MQKDCSTIESIHIRYFNQTVLLLYECQLLIQVSIRFSTGFYLPTEYSKLVIETRVEVENKCIFYMEINIIIYQKLKILYNWMCQLLEIGLVKQNTTVRWVVTPCIRTSSELIGDSDAIDKVLLSSICLSWSISI